MVREVNVLIIDEDTALAEQLDNTLKAVGYHTWVVTDPKEGLELLRTNALAW